MRLIAHQANSQGIQLSEEQFALQFEEMEGRRRAEAKIAKRKQEKEELAKEENGSRLRLAEPDRQQEARRRNPSSEFSFRLGLQAQVAP